MNTEDAVLVDVVLVVQERGEGVRGTGGVQRVHDGAALVKRLLEFVDEALEARVETEVEEEIQNLHCSATQPHAVCFTHDACKTMQCEC